MSTRYHRLARESPSYAWWRLPVAGLLAVVLYFGLTFVLVGAAFFGLAPGRGADGLEQWFDAAGDLDLTQLDFFLLDMSSLVILIPSVLAALWIVGARPVGYLSSVTGRLRWAWLGRTAVMSFVVFGASLGGWLVVSALSDPSEVERPSDIGVRTVAAIVLVLLVTPFQAAAEEYVFRGYLMQLVGSWTRFATIPVIVSVPPFVAGHTYEFWGLVDVGLFGLTAAILTIRTGGLEAAISAHAANNIILFVLDALGVVVATDDSGSGPLDLVPTVVAGVLIVAWVEWSVRRHGIQRTRERLPEPVRRTPPPPPPPPVWGPPPPYWPPPVPAPAQVPAHVPIPVPVPVPPAPRLHPATPAYPGEVPDRPR